MALQSVRHEFTVDLTRPPALRFSELQQALRGEARALASEGLALISPLPEALRRMFALLHTRASGPYREEIAAWARALDLPIHDALCLQHLYEIAQAGERLMFQKRGLLGCTAAVGAPGLEAPVHLRTLDWPMPALSAATCVVRMRGTQQEFVVAGIAGMVGVLSGMVEGAYSVTINYAPPSERPGRGAAPAFLLRRVLETARTYQQAVEQLSTTPLAAPVFFTVCGARAGEACVIERVRKSAALRTATRDTPISQANLHVSTELADCNAITRNAAPESLFCSSDERRFALAARLSALGSVADLDALAPLLDAGPVLNDMTYQAMAFRPATGDYRVWRRAPV